MNEEALAHLEEGGGLVAPKKEKEEEVTTVGIGQERFMIGVLRNIYQVSDSSRSGYE